MKEILLNIATSYYTWIALELIVLAVLVFFVRKNKRRKKAISNMIVTMIKIFFGKHIAIRADSWYNGSDLMQRSGGTTNEF